MASLTTAIAAVGVVLSALSQTATNGLSNLGTLTAPLLPDYMANNPLPNGYPWGTATCNNTNPYTNPPNTGVIRSYDLTISRGYIAPDGVNKSVLLINGQFPGPTLQANWGDTFQITVNNMISGPEEGTSMHWHGLLQKHTPYYDGVPAVSQCPIAPGSSFTYTFQADLYGSSWYHSHYSAQYAGGIFGPMIIYGPKNTAYDVDIGPVVLSDWYHTDYFSIVEQVMAAGAGPPPIPDNSLINGKMDFDCALAPSGVSCTPNAGLSKFMFKTGKLHRLRLINTSAQSLLRFTIDGHNMTVMANDFVPVEPYETNMVTLGVGQRTDVIVKATGKPSGAYYMRSDISGKCSPGSPSPHGLAVIYYPRANTSMVPNSTATSYSDAVCGNDPLSETVPYYSITPPATPAVTQEIDITLAKNATGHTLWFMNNSTFRANYNNPLLLLANQGNTSYPMDPEWNVYNFGKNTSIRLVVRNYFFASHPMHMHGHNFYVLSEGPGDWDGSIVNPTNPQRRDVQMLQPGSPTAPSHLVIEINADNPGVWPFHCHIAWHVSAGLYVNIMERPDLITERQIPSVVAHTCTNWAAYTKADVVDEIDSGE